ncbi:hypothetical protein [Acholeplasma oculi]|uniref:hypothetical protein n=1 Tax=Acholeplasma oculi TaxID=35623 RepID=UPI0009A58C59|nr:hypothetical protein [Acholeplasma oculi]
MHILEFLFYVSSTYIFQYALLIKYIFMDTSVVKNDKLSFPSLIRFNKIVGSVHLFQGILMMLFAFFIYPNLDGTGAQTILTWLVLFGAFQP